MLNIALDGPSGSGKSTVAKIISEKLNILYLDTGAMYRATAIFLRDKNLADYNEESVSKALDELDLRIAYENGKQKTMLGDKDVSLDIRQNSVSMLASKFSAFKCVRIKMVDMQRKIAENLDCVLDGRDIGTCVLPNAKYKFFITAKPEIRAERRQKELAERGQMVEFFKLLEEIKTRDYNDSHREFSPLKQAEDAILIDTSSLNIDGVVEKILSVLEK